MSGRPGGLNLYDAIGKGESTNSEGAGSSSARADDRYDNSRDRDGGYRNYRSGDRGYRDRGYGEGSRGYDDRDRGYGNRDRSYGDRRQYNDRSYGHRDSYGSRDGDRRRDEPRMTTRADEDNDWRRKPVEGEKPKEEVRESTPRNEDRRDNYRHDDGYHRDNRRDDGYHRDNYRRDDGYHRDNYRRDDGYHRDNYRRDDGYHRDNDRPRYDREESRDGDRPRYNRDEESRDGDRPRYGRSNDRPRYGRGEERPREESPRVERAVPMKTENRFGVLEEDNEDDVAELSLEQLKARAAEKNRALEEAKAKAKKERDEAFKKITLEESVKFEITDWEIEMPSEYSSISIASTKYQDPEFNDMIKRMGNSKSTRETQHFIEDVKPGDVAIVLYRVYCYGLRYSNEENHLLQTIVSLTKALDSIVSVRMVDNVVQRCYLDADSIPSKTLASTFVQFVKLLAEEKLLSHLPTRDKGKIEEAKEAKEAKVEEKVEAKEAKVEKAEKTADYSDFVSRHLFGDDLLKAAVEMKLPKDPKIVYALLCNEIGDHDVAELIKKKNEALRLKLLSSKVFGTFITEFYDGEDLSVHVEILNQFMRYWDEKQQPADFLEACFYSAFENALVYDEALEEWFAQGSMDLAYTKATVRLSSIRYAIQSMIESRNEEEE